jgi:hypothetical protein
MYIIPINFDKNKEYNTAVHVPPLFLLWLVSYQHINPYYSFMCSVLLFYLRRRWQHPRLSHSCTRSEELLLLILFG